MYQESQVSPPLRAETPEAFEMSNFSRSRQSSKTQVPLSNLTNNDQVPGINEEDEEEEGDEISSSTPSVFEDEPQGSTYAASSATSVDDLIPKEISKTAVSINFFISS